MLDIYKHQYLILVTVALNQLHFFFLNFVIVIYILSFYWNLVNVLELQMVHISTRDGNH